MNDEALALGEELLATTIEGRINPGPVPEDPEIPAYLEDTYWWAYLRPRSIWLFERDWLVNAILWGNMRGLGDAVIDELRLDADGDTLQLACVYGEFTARLTRRLNRRLHLADIAPIQLDNARRKLRNHDNVRFHCMDSSRLQFSGARFEHTVVFFLLHEQPADVRRRSIAEAIRVTKPGGKVIVVDYHCPSPIHPLRYLMWPVLRWLEPFALDLWRQPLTEFLPEGFDSARASTKLYFGGLYQKVVIRC